MLTVSGRPETVFYLSNAKPFPDSHLHASYHRPFPSVVALYALRVGTMVQKSHARSQSISILGTRHGDGISNPETDDIADGAVCAITKRNALQD